MKYIFNSINHLLYVLTYIKRIKAQKCFALWAYSVIIQLACFVCIIAQPKKEPFISLLNDETLNQWTYWYSDPSKTFPLDSMVSVLKQNNQFTLYLSGKPKGGLLTVDIYENFHLKLEYKWGKKVKKDDTCDSGILYFVEPNIRKPTYDWPAAHEFQLQEDHSGDYWPLGDVQAKILTKFDTLEWVFLYDPYSGQEVKFPTIFPDSVSAPRCAARSDVEYEVGEWNSVDLYCFKGRCAHVLNGQKIMQIEAAYIGIDSQTKSHHKGHIMLQSEDSPIYFRKIKIRRLHHFPNEISTD